MQSDMPKGWKFLTGDVNWEDYGGSWYKHLKGTRTYFLIRYDNGHEHDKDLPRHLVDVYSVNLDDIDTASVLRTCGWTLEPNGSIWTGSDWIEYPMNVDLAIVEAALQYGAAAPLWDNHGDKHRARLIAEARRYADCLIKDATGYAKRLKRPVNAIGSTAAEYARGDIKSALARGTSPMHDLMRKIGVG